MKIKGMDKGSYFLIEIGETFHVKMLVEIKSVVEDAVQGGHNTIIFDLTNCGFIDSSGVGLLINLQKRCASIDGHVGLLSPSREIRDIISIAGVEEFMRIYQSESEVE